MKSVKIIASVVLLAGGSVVSSGQTVSPRVFSPGEESAWAPPVDVWLDQASYDYGARIRPYFSTEPGAYVTIVRVTSDGELRVLYPRRPSSQRPYVIGQMVNNRVPYSGDPTFNLYESTGIGFVFALASYDRFDYSYFTSGGEWSIARLASSGRYGDPFEIIRRFVDRTLSDRSEHSVDYASYEVQARGIRSRYATRYGWSTYNDYYDACVTAFGLRYTSYCQGYNFGYYGQVIYVPPRTPSPSTPSAPRAPREPRVKPLVPDPMVPYVPLEKQPVEGRFLANDRREAAAADRRERMVRDASPRVEMRARSSEPRNEAPRAEPQRAEPRPEPPRAQPQTPARVEVRNEPPPQPVQRAEPVRIEQRPVKKDSDQAPSKQ